ncbi:MAG: RNA-binding S4 domain-containing protein [Saprospiraceae bacterium]|nr:RNA-binding S4 domain-containing protein [Saprospiraceae bacterium]
MAEMTFTLNEKEGFIVLLKLLKIQSLAQSGGHAKMMVEDGLVFVNGEQEFRKRRKLRPGDKIEVEGALIEIEQ